MSINKWFRISYKATEPGTMYEIPLKNMKNEDSLYPEKNWVQLKQF